MCVSRYLIRFLAPVQTLQTSWISWFWITVVVMFAVCLQTCRCLATVVCVFSHVQSVCLMTKVQTIALLTYPLSYLAWFIGSCLSSLNKINCTSLITLVKHVFLCGRGWWYILSRKWILDMHHLPWWNVVFMSHLYKNINSHYTFGHHYKMA